MDWKILEESFDTRLERAPVDGGWLYRATVYETSWCRATQCEDEKTLSQSITFVPSREASWQPNDRAPATNDI